MLFGLENVGKIDHCRIIGCSALEAAMIWLLEASVTTIHQLSVQKDNMQELRRVARAQHTQVDSDLFDFEF